MPPIREHSWLASLSPRQWLTLPLLIANERPVTVIPFGITMFVLGSKAISRSADAESRLRFLNRFKEMDLITRLVEENKVLFFVSKGSPEERQPLVTLSSSIEAPEGTERSLNMQEHDALSERSLIIACSASIESSFD